MIFRNHVHLKYATEVKTKMQHICHDQLKHWSNLLEN